MAMNLRLDAAHEELLAALAAQERRTKTEIIKLAIEERAAEPTRAREFARSSSEFGTRTLPCWMHFPSDCDEFVRAVADRQLEFIGMVDWIETHTTRL